MNTNNFKIQLLNENFTVEQRMHTQTITFFDTTIILKPLSSTPGKSSEYRSQYNLLGTVVIGVDVRNSTFANLQTMHFFQRHQEELFETCLDHFNTLRFRDVLNKQI